VSCEHRFCNRLGRHLGTRVHMVFTDVPIELPRTQRSRMPTPNVNLPAPLVIHLEPWGRIKSPRWANSTSQPCASCPSCQSVAIRIIARTPKSLASFCASRPDQRGVRVVTNVGAGCDGRFGNARRTMPGRTAKSCGPDAPTLASSSREASFLGATVARKPGHRGEREISRKTIAQGRPDCLR